MKKIEPKRIIGVNMYDQPCELFTLRTMHIEGMQEFLCSDGKEKYEKEQRINSFFGPLKILASDSEEQLRYNAFMENILNYKDYDEYKYKNSFKYKVLKVLKLVK